MTRLLALLALVSAFPALAEESWTAPRGATAIAYPGETLTVRSDALGRDVEVRVHRPLLGAPPFPGAILYALVDPAQGARIVAELRRRELESSMFGVTVVTIGRPDFGREAWEPAEIADFSLDDRRLYSGETIRARPDAFERFLYDELVPAVEAGRPVTGERILGGVGWAGGFVLRMAAKRPDGFGHHVALDPMLQDGDVESIIAAGVPHPEGHAGHLDVGYARGFPIPSSEMERLLEWLEENGHGTNVAVDGDSDDMIAAVAGGESMVPPR